MNSLSVPNFSPIGVRIHVLWRILRSVRKEVEEKTKKPPNFGRSYGKRSVTKFYLASESRPDVELRSRPDVDYSIILFSALLCDVHALTKAPRFWQGYGMAVERLSFCSPMLSP